MHTAALNLEHELARLIAGFATDPHGYVRCAFPWGKGELAGETGPRRWQAAFLEELGEKLRGEVVSRRFRAVREATASGHGVGKSAVVSWLALWAMSSYERTRGIVTANTETQLRTKTSPELAKWHGLAANRHWFRYQVLSLASAEPGQEKNWRIDLVPWSDTNPQAFAGLHNKGRRILLLFDEASEISDRIWEVADGALTDADTEMLWCAFGNPTEASGRFADCFERDRALWGTRHIDSRYVEGTNRAELDELVAKWGEDHDLVRVRVRGLFPRQSTTQFIGQGLVDAAARREAIATATDPVVLGLDIAREGDDESVLCVRHGRDARTWPWQVWRERDSMQLAGKVAQHYRYLHDVGLGVDALFADGAGVGGPVCDRLRQLGVPVLEVNGGSTARNEVDFADRNAEMWHGMRDWLSGGAIPDDPVLTRQLVRRNYDFQANRLVMESKKHMKARGVDSPDRADALALTFAAPVMSRAVSQRHIGPQFARRDHDPLGGD